MMMAAIGRGFAGGFGGPGACHGMFYGGFGMMHMGIWIIILAIIIGVVIWKRGHHGSVFGHGDPALNILREKFAKGEITEEEFLSRKALLTRK